MASKLELLFHSEGVIGQTFTVFGGSTYTFVVQRSGLRQVTTTDAINTGRQFSLAFKNDDNYLSQFTVTCEPILLDEFGVFLENPQSKVTIEHPDNTFFSGVVNNTTFIAETITTTTQEVLPELTASLSASATDACGKFSINIDSNVEAGRVTVEIPVGNKILDIETTSLPYVLDRLRPPTSTTGVVKLFRDTTTQTPVKTFFFAAPAPTHISNVEVNGSPFGAVAQINANGSNLQYSLNNSDWQNSKEYTWLLAGNFTAYVKDAYGCTKTYQFVVTEDQASGLTVEPLIKVPIHNSLRWAERSGETFLNFLAQETPSFVNITQFYQDYLINDVVRTQFKSSYPVNRVFAYDCQGAETEIAIVQKSDNISRINIYQGNYVDYEGRLAVYFDAGNIYNPDDTIKDTHSLSGLLPDWYYEGMYINIEGAGVTRIDRIIFDEDAEVVYAVTQKTGIGEGLGLKITSIHTAHPYEVYEFDINFLEEGKYIFKLDYGAGMFFSEPVKVHEELSDKYLKVEWFSKHNNDIIYGTGIRQMRRLKWASYFKYIPKSEKETFYSDTTLGNVNSKSHSTYEIGFMPMPMEMARGLDFGFNASGGYVIINGAVFVCDGAFKAEPFGPMYKVSAELTLTDQSMKGQQNVMDAIIAQFLIVEQDVNGVKFLRL